MKTVPLDELDEKTGQWLREACQHDQVLVTSHGKPMVTIQPFQRKVRPDAGFHNRILLPGFEAIMNQDFGGSDSTDIISQDREDRL